MALRNRWISCNILTETRKSRRLAWVRGRVPLDPVVLTGPPVDPEARRIAEEIKQRVRAQRVAAGRV